MKMPRRAVPWVLCVAIDDGASQDVFDKDRRTKIEQFRIAGAVASVNAGPTCACSPVATTPPVEIIDYLQGVPWTSSEMPERMRI